jgi:sugar (pentulose or hexulose) kinase
LWAEALDLMIERLATSGLDMNRLVAISGSAQQHGS